MDLREDYFSFQIRSVVMSRPVDTTYTFYLSCGHLIRLPIEFSLKVGTTKVKTIVRCYKCPRLDEEITM